MADNEITDELEPIADEPVNEGRSLLQRLPVEMIGNILLLGGVVLFMWATFILFQHAAAVRAVDQADQKALNSKQLIDDQVHRMRGLLQNRELHQLIRAGLLLFGKESTEADIQNFLRERDAGIYVARVLPAPLSDFDPTEDISNGYIIYEMLLEAHLEKLAPMQVINPGTPGAVLVGVIRIDQETTPVAYLLAYWDVQELLDNFPIGGLLESFVALQQATAARSFLNLKARGPAPTGWFGAKRLQIEGTRFYVALPSTVEVEPLLAQTDLVLSMILGAILWSVGLILRRRALAPQSAELILEADPLFDDLGDTEEVVEDPTDFVEPSKKPEKKLLESDDDTNTPPVDLKPSIFRAYDIRGIVGFSIDAGVARQIGQAVGSLALERGAIPVAVGCDGRLSGPRLKAALIEGLSSTGCSAVDVGAVPTPVLYYAAVEMAGGSGVMVTGSHNPPDYNGFKIVIGGDTLYGGAITGLYDRIMSGDLSQGAGEVSEEYVLDRYRDRIASDVKLERPLKVVADCGNGIGGIVAPSVLRAIGAEVFPLFEEVDGTFPNHHPDPSVRENLEDLITHVRLMKADLGVAFDGDADRLGVVTPQGEIIYADRLMMLFARDILERNPGGTVIYDVKCSSHLATAIEEAGGTPMMYKTGHSLIKAKMKEVDTPFSGEMSGHFFIKERWYGFDDGIYSAARLLEILAKDERAPGSVLSSLPKSVSTPELNLQMAEGETQPFMKEFIDNANFGDAKISNIDGLRADFDDGWGLVRASNTTPVLVLRFEANSRAALERIQELFRTELLNVRKGLVIPF